MKGRSMKLKEAHKSNGVSSFCSILFDLESHHRITSSASDSSISIHNLLDPSKPTKFIRNHKEGVTALSLSPNSTCLASGSLDHSVKLYKFPGGEFQSNVTRFTLPIRSLAFNKSGSLLAAAGDDEGIKLIATIDGSVSRVLKGHKGPVTGLSFDPTAEYLASVDGIGTVIYWELSSGKPIHTLTSISPDCGSDTSVLNVLSWSPDGETLAVPGLKNDVVMYDRDTAEKLFSLKGDHGRSVCFLSWSPNGKYMATSGLDKQVLIWDVDQRQDIDRQKFDERICCLTWKPNGNALAVIDVMGKFGMWESVVPSYMKSPTDGAPNLQSRNNNGLLLFDEDDQEPSTSGSLSDIDEGSLGEFVPVRKKRLRKQSVFDDDLDEDSDGNLGLLPHIELQKELPRKLKEKKDGKERFETLSKVKKPMVQEAFQPGSTSVQAGKRHFLCYNMLGSITSINNDGHSHIEVDFHDTGRGPRVPSMTDYFGFTMASLNESGSVFANPCKGEKNLSTLMYRPFSSWANNSEWSMRFEAEEVKVVAIGTGWVAAVTSLNFLRIFTEGGLQRYILSLDGPVVTAAGSKDQLAIVTHASDCLPSGDQMLEFKVLNIYNGTQPIKGHLPLTPGSTLTWLGFTEEGQLSSYDSKGVLRVFTYQYGGCWLPLFSAGKERKSEEESYWIVGLNATKLFCIVCKSPDLYPLVMPKPVLTLLSLSFPLASSDLGADDLENEFIMSNLYLSQTQKKIEEMAAVGLDTTALDDEAFNMEATLDRCILRLIASCCNGDKLVRASELARLLSLEKSLKGAIKLVTALKLPILAERFNGILEERLLNESLGPVAHPTANATLTNGFKSHGNLHVVESTRGSEASNPSLPPPLFLKQEKADERIKMGKEMEYSQNASVGNTKEGPNQVHFHQPTNPFAKSSNKPEKSQDKPKMAEEKIESNGNVSCGNAKLWGNQVQFQRPANPFAKASNNQDKSTLLDSIMKLKKVDDEPKDNGGAKKTRK
ncbi:transducin family protein / WD-40 repeat family protein [Tasmannia lanceolata]|uniref:transducin family protein / WD-40 repeat family protein n=1 Tax=Tasmannia lanceolata TaxID=3420 RepID=UPI004063F400